MELLNQKTNYSVKNASVFGSNLINNYKIFKNILNKNNNAKFYISLAFDDIGNEPIFNNNESLKNNINKENWVNILKKNYIISYLSNLLRAKSATYVYLKTSITNSEINYYKNDLKKFENINNLNNASMYFDKFAEYKNQITFYILPYSQQVNNLNCLNRDIAEKFFIEELNKKNLRFILFKNNFCTIKNTKTLFLKNDHAHLSKKGHEFVYKIFKSEIN